MLSIIVWGVLFLGVLMLFKRSSMVPYYYLLWFVLFIYVEGCFFMMDYEDVSNNKKMQLYYLLITFIYISIAKFKELLKDNFLIYSFFFIFYLFFLAFVRGGGGSFLFFMAQMIAFIPLWFVVKSSSSFPTHMYEKGIRLILIFELLLGFLQIVFNVAYPSYAERDIRNGALNVIGTFSRYNAYSEQISLLSLSLLIISFYQSKKKMRFDWLLVFLAYVMVVMSGARTQLLAMTVTMSIILFDKISRRMRFPFIVLMISVFFLFQNVNNEGQTFENANLNRQMELMKIKTESNYLSQGSTSQLSFYLLNEFISSPQTYLTGPGKLFTEVRGYGGRVMRGGLMYDSFLLIFLCETGFIGIVLLTLCLFSILKKCRFNRNAMAILLFLLIVSVTDWGFFEGYSVIYFLFIIKYINGKTEDLQRHHSTSQHSRVVEPLLGKYSAT